MFWNCAKKEIYLQRVVKFMKKVFLVCNAHLDPVWLWQRAEGMAEAIATFRIAADFCEKYDNFVFNHNESVLYEWVMENEPELFERIKRLVKQGKWRIMSGWYLQPDVVMPSGESIIRQIRVGNDFFKEHFGEIPKTAIGFDAFGHSRGLVQILKKCGYENYAYLRPRDKECGPFIWEGFDGSEINTLKLYEWYNTPKGEAVNRIENYVADFPNREVNCVTWGIGNHGGGPSEKDFLDITEFANNCKDFDFLHSDFDTFFKELDKTELEVLDESLTHCMVGCYTSMVRVKQAHRNLENKLSLCERMLCQSKVDYSKEMLLEAEKALLFSEFHDVLPGSAIKRVEDDALNLLGYGAEITDRLISKAFFKLCKGQKKANDGEIPVLIYNPHPFEIEGDFDVEFQMVEQNDPNNGVYNVYIYNENGKFIPSQLEQEDSAHGSDWRKKVSFHTTLKPMGITRLDCVLKCEKDFVAIKPYNETDEHIILKNDFIEVRITKKTGLIESFVKDGKNMLNSLKIKAYKDNADPWGMLVDEFSEVIGEFKLNKGVRVIENGDVRTKIQADFKWNNSFAFITYIFSKNSKHFDIQVKMLTNDENTMFKMVFDTTLDKDSKALGQTMFGTETLRKEGKEVVFQKWCGLNNENQNFNIINSGTYGGSFDDNEIRISLLRTPVYSAHPVDYKGVELAPDNRIYNHIDMGERDFSFRILVDEEHINFEAEKFNIKPYILSFFPSGLGEKNEKPITLNNKNIILSAYKNERNSIVIRLFNSSSSNQNVTLKFGTQEFNINFTPFEVKTFIFYDDSLLETNMI